MTKRPPISERLLAGARERFAAERACVARNSIPRLIELLESPSLRTRFLAEMCLRDAAGT